MNDKIIKAGMVMATIAWVKAYGKYKYYCGRVDANETNKIIIDVQKTFIDDLMKELKKREHGEA